MGVEPALPLPPAAVREACRAVALTLAVPPPPPPSGSTMPLAEPCTLTDAEALNSAVEETEKVVERVAMALLLAVGETLGLPLSLADELVLTEAVGRREAEGDDEE